METFIYFYERSFTISAKVLYTFICLFIFKNMMQFFTSFDFLRCRNALNCAYISTEMKISTFP